MATPKHPIGMVIVLLCALILASSAIALSLPLVTYQCDVVGNYNFYTQGLEPPSGDTVSYRSTFVRNQMPTVYDNRGVFKTNLILSSISICFAFFALASSVPLTMMGHDQSLWVLIPSLIICMVLLLDAASILAASILYNFSSIGNEVCNYNPGKRVIGPAGVFEFLGGASAFVALVFVSLLFCCDQFRMKRDITMSLSGDIGLDENKKVDVNVEDEVQAMMKEEKKKKERSNLVKNAV